MNITIIGTGNIGTAISADLIKKGHKVSLLKTSDKSSGAHYSVLKNSKKIELIEDGESCFEELTNVTTDVAAAMASAETVILAVQTAYHKSVIHRIAPYIKDGQTFIIVPGYLSTCYFLQETQRNITIIEAESSPIDCRITGPGRVKALFRNVLNPVGVFPLENREKAKQVLDGLQFPYTFTRNVLEAALHNPNLIVHTVGAVFSIPRIEYSKGKYSMYREVFTPHVWNMVEALDQEKINVLKKAGCVSLPYVEACKQRNSTDKDSDAKAVFFDYANNSAPDGPSVPDSRYVMEDVPQGLVMLESLGVILGVKTPVCTGLINLAAAAMKKDFREEGRTIDKLGRNNIMNILDRKDI